jgi:NAD(P)-dependent dehydrogenase (short-subunit alcohol dehydrogenase family)
VIITARDATNLTAAADQLNAIPGIIGRAVPIAANVGHTDQIQKFVSEVESEIRKSNKKGVDILMANAASSWGGPFEEFEDWKSQKTLDLNVRGVFNLVRLYVTT